MSTVHDDHMMRTENFSICMIKIGLKGIEKLPQSKVRIFQIRQHNSSQRNKPEKRGANSKEKRKQYPKPAAAGRPTGGVRCTFRDL
jgi:hypothetical protein